VSLTDSDGLVTTVTRDAAGTPLQIVGPYGHRTELSLDENGYLNRIEDPEGGAWIADYDDLGLMLSWTNRNGHQKTLTWDSGGRLLSVTDAALATTTLTPTTTETGRVVTLESALGRARSYGLERAAGPSEVRTFTGADGLTTTTTRNGSGVATSVAPDGTTTSTQLAPDPRFGLAAPYVSREIVTLPSGLTVTLSRERSVTLAPRRWRLRLRQQDRHAGDRRADRGRSPTTARRGRSPRRAPKAASAWSCSTRTAGSSRSRTRERCRSPSTTTSTAAPRRSSRARARRPSRTARTACSPPSPTPYRPHHLLHAGRRRPRPSGERPDLEATLFAYDLEGNATTVTPRVDPRTA
jgi:YD repeat-containing protein